MIDPIVTAILVFIFGTLIGSFLNVVIWRLPREEKISRGLSRCPSCGHELGPLDLIPVISYLFSRGRCRYCAAKISPRYPIIEIITAILFTASFVLLKPESMTEWLAFVQLLFVIGVLIAVFVIDLEHYLILDKIVLPATLLILAANLGWDFYAGSSFQSSVVLSSIIGAIAGYVPFYLLWKFSRGTWMGLGDAKFGLFLGAVFGFPQIGICYLLAFFIGTAFALPLLLTGKSKLSSRLPFGTFLAIAAVIMLWFGSDLTSWYLGILGLRY